MHPQLLPGTGSPGHPAKMQILAQQVWGGARDLHIYELPAVASAAGLRSTLGVARCGAPGCSWNWSG